MILSFFSSRGWESWDVERRPVIPERMPISLGFASLRRTLVVESQQLSGYVDEV
jgi:hypothetical protein